MEQVANHFKRFMFAEHYEREFALIQDKPSIGFMIAGYSFGQPCGELWKLTFQRGSCEGPTLVFSQDVTGMMWEGLPFPLRRLVLGFEPDGLAMVLSELGLAPELAGRIIDRCREVFSTPLVNQGMPIQDAIDLAIFMEETAAGFTRFATGPNTVGGPVEVAVITKHEGFKWVRRKHFYDKSLNP